MTTVILSLPKSIIFVALGAASSEHSKGAKVGKVIAVGVLVAIMRELPPDPLKFQNPKSQIRNPKLQILKFRNLKVHIISYVPCLC